MADTVVEGGAYHDVQSLLSSPDRDFLIRSNGDQVKVDCLKGKKVGLYFSASWCGPCQRFTPILKEVYNELSPKGDLEIVLISAERDEESFNGYFSKMPWLAIPFSDSNNPTRFNKVFKIRGIPHLVILDGNGTVLTEDGDKIIRAYGVEGHPFTPERIRELKDEDEAARKNQSLTSVLVHGSRDFVVSFNGTKVPITELQGKTVGLYFFLNNKSCGNFMPKLLEVYEKLKTEGESFEIVQIPLDDDEASFNETSKGIPWLSLPIKDKKREKLFMYFEVSALPGLVIIGPDGKTLHSNVSETVEEHGVAAYPFTPEKFAELAEMEKKREESQTLESILVSGDLDFVIGKEGIKVKVDSLKGKKIGLYFSASWCGPCQRFTPILKEVYNELSPKGDLEIVLISAERDEESFNGYFSKMPWLAIPFSDSDNPTRFNKVFKIRGIPHLVILDANGTVLTENGDKLIRAYGVEGHPFTPERIRELKDQDEAARKNQSLTSVLVHGSRDFVVSFDGTKVPITELQGKTVGLYFFLNNKSCGDFMPKLLEVYEKLKTEGESFEIVQIPLDDDEASFNETLKGMPWLSLPLKDKKREKLFVYFEVSAIPGLVIIGPDGKTLHSNVSETVEEHGVAAYPFTPEKFAELAEMEKKREESQTLESILVSGDLDFVIGKEGIEIPISDLVGKTVLLYFSAHWCPPCRAFLPALTEAYEKIKAKDNAFELIFLSSDKDQIAFDNYFSEMPWLALPFGDERKNFLSRKFKVRSIPTLIAIGPTGRTLTNKARNLVINHGADAYPFTAEHLKKFEASE